MSRKLTEAKKKSIASRQDFQCANKPGANLPGIEDYKCLLWARNDPTKLGNFDGAGYEIDHIKEYCDSKDDSDSNLQALCCSCHAIKTRNFMMNNKRKPRKNQKKQKGKSQRKYDSDDSDDDNGDVINDCSEENIIDGIINDKRVIDESISDESVGDESISDENNFDGTKCKKSGKKNNEAAPSKKIKSKETTVITKTIYSESTEESTDEESDNENAEDFSKNAVFMKILKDFSSIKIPKKFVRDFSIIGNVNFANKPCIDFDILVLWLGMRKDHVKTTLTKNFFKKHDYVIHASRVDFPRGSTIVHNILITSTCCKSILAKTRGLKAEKMLDYFVSLEFSFKKYHKDMQYKNSKKRSSK